MAEAVLPVGERTEYVEPLWINIYRADARTEDGPILTFATREGGVPRIGDRIVIQRAGSGSALYRVDQVTWVFQDAKATGLVRWVRSVEVLVYPAAW